MNKVFLYLLFLSCYSCGHADCGLHEYEKSFWWHRNFKQPVWREGDIYLNSRYLMDADSINLYYQVLDNRERMLCDLVQNHLKPSQNIAEIVSLLGPSEIDASVIWGKILFEENGRGDDLLDEIFETKLVYLVGRNASGTCYLILVFDKGQYIGSYRSLAQ